MADASNRAAVTRRNVLALGGATLALGACGIRPDPPTELTYTLLADSSINPNEAGQPSPVLVRLYELKSPSSFEAASLFDLLDDDDEVLGGDLVNRREVEVKPGDNTAIERETSAETRYIGAIAAFRDIDNATWRGHVAIEPHDDHDIIVTLTGTTMDITLREGRLGRFSIL